jgi:hypothetical protein
MLVPQKSDLTNKISDYPMTQEMEKVKFPENSIRNAGKVKLFY